MLSAIRSFGTWISNYDWAEELDHTDVDTIYEKFIETLNTKIDLFFPVKRVKIQATDKPWMTPQIKRLIKSRQVAFHCKDMISWRRLRTKIIACIAVAKKQYYATRVAKLKQSKPSAWFH